MTCPVCNSPALERFDNRRFFRSTTGHNMHESCAIRVHDFMDAGSVAMSDNRKQGYYITPMRRLLEYPLPMQLWNELNEWRNNE